MWNHKFFMASLRSSCILLDQQWNPKIASFGLVELLPSEYSAGALKNDVYLSFGILLMEIITEELQRTAIKSITNVLHRPTMVVKILLDGFSLATFYSPMAVKSEREESLVKLG
ncbi:putative serine/threonine-protein kinase, partial [Cucurbita argyrosperma subsp. sororia]